MIKDVKELEVFKLAHSLDSYKINSENLSLTNCFLKISPPLAPACAKPLRRRQGRGFTLLDRPFLASKAKQSTLSNRVKGRGTKFLLSTPTFILPHQRGRRLHGGNFKYFWLVLAIYDGPVKSPNLSP